MIEFSYSRKWFFLFFFFTCKYSSAQTKLYNLTELIDSAKQNLPLLMEKEALIDVAKANITDVNHSFLPTFNIGAELSIGTANDVAGNYLPVNGIVHPVSGGITDKNNYDAQTNNLTSAYVEYDLINFGLRKAAVNKAVANSDVQQADFDRELYQIKIQISNLYFDILKNVSLLKIDKENISRYETVYKIIYALTSSGINAGVDSSLAKAELSKIKVNYNQRSGIVNQLVQRLSFYTGISAANIFIDTIRNKGISVSPDVYDTASSINNPLLTYYEKQRLLYKSSEHLIRKSYLPKVVLLGGGWARGSSIQYSNNYKPLDDGLGWQRFNYLGGIAVTYNLFNPVHEKNKLLENQYQLKAAEYSIEQQKLVLNNSSAEAQVAIQTDKKNLEELPIQIQAASDAYNQKLAQYQAGIINLIDLLNASFVLYSAQQNYSETLTDWYKANLQKAAATGTLDDFIQNIQK